MRRNIFRGIGILAALLLAALFLVSAYQEQKREEEKVQEEEEEVSLAFEPEELVYSGSGELNLMEGVTAADADGKDITDQVNAVLTGEESGGEKKIRYSVFSSSGREVTKERTLILENYQGPQIQVQEPLNLEADDLDDLIARLKERGEIKGTDGFGLDVTDQITWCREKISKGIYQITFSLDNAYLDHEECQVQANISGEVPDLTLTLRESRIEIPPGSEFSPWDYLESADDPSFGNIGERVQIQSMVDTGKPGNYSVIYSVTSVDGTQTAQAVLNVTVTGELQ
ncbi:MAG: immunoglobulin-like domain-containing protein [Ruminococcus sp.]|jgi:hypothetical protein